MLKHLTIRDKCLHVPRCQGVGEVRLAIRKLVVCYLVSLLTALKYLAASHDFRLSLLTSLLAILLFTENGTTIYSWIRCCPVPALIS